MLDNIYIYNNTSFLNDIALVIQKLIPNSIITTSFHGLNNYYIILSAINYFEQIPMFYDVIQLEQLEHPALKIENNSYYIKVLRNAKNIYDYSRFNIDVLNKQLILNSPVKYANFLINNGSLYINKQNKYKNNNKYKVSFIGTTNERRSKLIKYINNNNIEINSFNNLNNNEKCIIQQQSQIILNLHYYPNAVLEIERINDSINNKCFIISETSADPELDDMYKDYVIFVKTPEELIEKIEYYILHPEAALDFANKAYDKFKKSNDNTYPLGFTELFKFNNINKDNIYPEIEPYKVLRAEYEINTKDNEKILKLSKYPEFNDLPKISLITITKNREIFYSFMINNFLNFKYPINNIEWIILDDGDNDNTEYFSKYKKIKYYYKGANYYNSIAQKRNDAIELTTNDIIVHFDDDDYYFPQSLYSKVKLLLFKNKQEGILCVGTDNIGIYNLAANNSYLHESAGIAEASMCYFKSFWNERRFYDHFNGEGFTFLKNRYSKVCILSYEYNLIVLNHKTNYTGRNRYISNLEINTNEIYKLFDFKTQSLLIGIRKKLDLILD